MMEGKLKEQLDIWLKQEVVQPSSSPWSFPLIAVPKKNGKTRWVIDYRRLNEITTVSYTHLTLPTIYSV